MKGTVYGATTEGGSSNDGTVFALNASGSETVLHNFTGDPDGAAPTAPLIDLKGILYGTTYAGGTGSACSAGCGTVYAIYPSGTERVLYSFKGKPDGAGPALGALIDVHDTLYGTTYSGGASDNGSVFKIAPSGAERVIYSFKGYPDGAAPEQALLYSHGGLYGTTTDGGVNLVGTVFRVSRSGQEQLLYQFKGEPDGAFPETQLVEVRGVLYGTTNGGGTSNDGTIFQISR
jgi:uncharacterized repeat protein (TIGR03803 family)